MVNRYKLIKFRGLVEKAIGVRSQAKFALDAGLSHAHLNRLLNHEKVAMPRTSTLLKIAKVADNCVTYSDLVNAINDDVRNEGGDDAAVLFNNKYMALKNEEAASDFKMTFGKHADKCYEILSETIDSMEYPAVISSLDLFMDSVLMRYEKKCRSANIPPLSISYYINDSLKYFGDKIKNVDTSFCNVLVSVSSKDASAESEIIIYTNGDADIEKSNLTAVLGASMHIDNLFDVFGWYPALTCGMSLDEYEKEEDCNFFDYMKSAKYYIHLKSDAEYLPRQRMSALQFLHSFVMEDPVFKPTCISGYGLYVSDSIHDKAYEFFINHKDALFELTASSQQYIDWKDTLYDLISSGINSGDKDDKIQRILAVFDDSTYDDIDDQLKYLICRVINKETGFPIEYYASEYDEEHNAYGDLIDKRDAYILTNESMVSNNIRITTLLNVFARYGRELGINKIEEMRYMTMMMFFGTQNKYTIRDCVDTDEEYNDIDVDTSDWISVQNAPDDMTPHRVLLKDGRIKKCLYVKGSWVSCHKDWRNFVDKYEKQVYDLKETR